MIREIQTAIPVARPSLPPLEEFIPYLQEIWKSRMLTNGGPLHQQLEQALSEYLGVEHIALFNNGTIALMTALKALGISGEVITTPYSFVATAHSLLWNGIKPIFVDIDPDVFNLDPSKIERAITPQTTAIMAVHCYGNPCDVQAIQAVADAHGLRVIYDAAHAFGVEDTGGSVLRHGDLSVLSFHATKVFSTFEGGAVVCPDETTKRRIDQLKNFGIVDEVTVAEVGLNGKMSEVNAALGLLQLKHVGKYIGDRREIDVLYRERLRRVKGISCLGGSTSEKLNYSYFPVLVNQNYPLSRDGLYQELKAIGVNSRRYFYPLISDFPMYSSFPTASADKLPIATSAAQQVLCLPIYPDLDHDVVHKICDLITK